MKFFVFIVVPAGSKATSQVQLYKQQAIQQHQLKILHPRTKTPLVVPTSVVVSSPQHQRQQQSPQQQQTQPQQQQLQLQQQRQLVSTNLFQLLFLHFVKLILVDQTSLRLSILSLAVKIYCWICDICW